MKLDLFAPATVRKSPRPHQVEALRQLRQSLGKGNKRPVLQLPTGAGKTFVGSQIVAGALDKGNRVCFTVPAISLVDQTVDAFEAEGIHRLGVIQANHVRTDASQPVQIASVQSLARRDRPKADIVVVDECHLQFKAIREWMRSEPDTVFIGLSATPWARGMAEDWQDLVRPVSMQDLIDAKFLSPFRVFAPSHPDLSSVSTVAGDYHEGQLGEVMGESRLVADVVDTWLQRADYRPTLIFAVNLAHAEKIRQAFADRGIAMGYCDAHVDLIERQALFADMEAGKLAGIVNVGTLTTGVDADVRCVVMARPTKSEMLFVQCIGRGLRTAPGKDDCLILDHADNHARLGFVTEIGHDRLLAGSEKLERKPQDKPEKLPRECSSCGALKERGPCQACGFEPSRQSEIEFEEGELVEIAPKATKPKASMDDKQRFYSQLISIRNQRGRSAGWVAHAYKERFGVWPRGLSERSIDPTPEVLAYVKSKDIRFAKRRKAA